MHDLIIIGKGPAGLSQRFTQLEQVKRTGYRT
jgi:hypothetical protein